MHAWTGALAILVVGSMACGVDGHPPTSEPDAGVDAGPVVAGARATPIAPSSMLTPSDRDMDGLCDRAERQLATNPDSADTDGDGLPDLIEVGNGFDAVNPDVPAEDQVAYLTGEPGALLDFPVRMTVDGDGSTLSGFIEVIGTIYGDSKNARDYVQGATATEANPIDGVRRIDANSARFAGVLGRTRLGFTLRFEYPSDEPAVACGRGYPLRYSLKGEDGSTVADRLFLLVVAPKPQPGHAPTFCAPVGCE